jgi:hypothetical protein
VVRGVKRCRGKWVNGKLSAREEMTEWKEGWCEPRMSFEVKRVVGERK